MKTIQLHGKYSHLPVLVDDADYEWLNQFRWHGVKGKHTVYARTSLGRIHVFMHRIILGLQPGEGPQTDHKDHNGLNNQRENLTPCNHSENQINRPHWDIGVHGFRGVHLSSSGRYYCARIMVNDREINRGPYKTPEDAARARNAMALEYFGDFARNTLNTIPGMSYQEMITDPGIVTIIKPRYKRATSSQYRGVSCNHDKRHQYARWYAQASYQKREWLVKSLPYRPELEKQAALYYDAAATLLYEKPRLNFPAAESQHLLSEVRARLLKLGVILPASGEAAA